MNEFKVESYVSFDETVRIINFSKECILQNLNNIKMEIIKLNADDVFSGPSAETVMNGWNNIVAIPYEQTIQELIKAEKNLPIFKENYIVSDSNNANNIGGISNG